MRDMLLTQLEQTYNIRITYESLSPSLLRAISLRNVKIYDAEHNIEIASFEDFSIQYRLWEAIFGSTAHILDSVNIANGFVDIDLVKNETLAAQLQDMLQSSDTASSPETAEELFSFFESQLLTVHIKNVRLRFKNDVHDLNARISDGICTIDETSLTVSLNSTASYQNAEHPDIGRAETAFIIEGKFNKGLTSGSMIADFSHFSTGQFGIDRLKLFADYRNKEFTFNTMQDFQPIDFTASWNVDTNDIRGQFSCEDFKPLQSISLYQAPKELAKFSPLTMSGNVQFSVANQQLQWSTDLNVALPPLDFSAYRFEDAQLHIKAEGTDKDIDISQATISGKDLDIFSKLAVNLDTKVPSGRLEIRKLRLPSGASAAADINFSTKKNTFICTIPSITIGDGQLHNIRLSVLPSGQKADYTLSAEDEYGKYSFDGSYIYDSDSGNTTVSPHFLELHGAFDAVGIGNVTRFIQAAFPDLNMPLSISESLQCTTEFYISSDLHSFSYNCIRFVLVSNALDDFYALVSLKGNQSSFSLTDIDISYKNMYLRGNINADFERLNDIIFNSSLVINSIGYQIQGFFSQNILNIYGDYGLAISALYDKTTGLQGTVKTHEMPIPFLPLFLTVDSGFRYVTPTDWNCSIDTGYISYGSPASLTPSALGLDFQGTADPTGLLLSKLKLGSEDALTGTLTVKTPAAKPHTPDPLDTTDTYTAAMHLTAPDNTEMLDLTAQLTTLDPFNIGGSLKLENISLARFFYTQGKNHRISANADFSASPDSLSFRFTMPQLALFIQGDDLRTSGSFVIENKKADLAINMIEWGAHRLTGITGSFSVDSLSGLLTADYTGEAATKQMKTHIRSVFAGVPPDDKTKSDMLSQLKSLAEQFTLNTYLSNWQFGDSSGKEEVPLSIIKEKEVTALYAGKNDDITGFLLNDGVVSLKFADTLPLKFSLDGSIKKDALDLRLTDLRADIKRIWDITGLDYVIFHEGALTGDLAIGGKPLEPEFTCKLEGRDIKVSSPQYAPEIFGPVALDIIADGTALEVPYTVLKGPSADLWARCTAEFSGWIPEDVAVQCGTLGTKKGVMKTDNLLFKADGFAGCTIDLNITPSRIGLYGSAAFDSGYFVFKFNDLDKFIAKYSNNGNIDFDMKLDVQLGHKAEFRWPTADFPILRALVPTEAPLTLTVNGNTGDFSMKGDVKMRGGEVFYIKRSFYIREGNINFADTGKEVDPRITLRAEIRDRDESGEPIRLILTAKDQPLFEFNPTLNSDPPRSSNEIMQLLGQVAIGDTGKDNTWQNLLVSSSDILAQIGFLKKSESKIRDFLGLDAFSFRTLLLQNAIFGNLFNINKNTTLTMSNYLDNTSVYIGKYFGSAIYADALLHLSHYDSKSLKNSSSKRPVYKNLLFQPEVGLEMATPFFLLRWSVAPTNPETLFVGDAALTFSWKYSY